MNLSADFNFETIQLTPDYEGEVVATLISSNFNTGDRKSVLYIHGYIDYFFQSHLCQKFIDNNFDFYAIDLRKYGRSLMQHQHPNFCSSIEEYFEEITIAIRQIHSNTNESIYLLGHSNGGLIASNYMNFGEAKDLIKGLILNSPFLDFNQSVFEKKAIKILAKIISYFSPYANVKGALSPVNGQSIHKDFYGEWDYNLEWKPIEGFPTYFKWILAIGKAQRKLFNSNIKVPILVMHSSNSRKLSVFTKDAITADVILKIEDIKRVGPYLGKRVTILKIDNALHDIFLSSKKVREVAFTEMFSWLKEN